MVHCIAKTAEKKRCTNEALVGEMFCGVHIKEKSVLGKSRRLSSKRCDKVAATRKSPFNHHKYVKGSKARKLILRTCDAHDILKMLKADEKKLKTLKRAAPGPAAKAPAAKKARAVVAKIEKGVAKAKVDLKANKPAVKAAVKKIEADLVKAKPIVKKAATRKSPRQPKPKRVYDA